MQSKALFVAIAAFALTATGVEAYGNEILTRAGLSSQQIAAFGTARQLHSLGQHREARDVLVEAGIDETTMVALQRAARELRGDIRQAVEDDDFAAFQSLTAGTPLGERVVTAEQFDTFVDAHDLRAEGSYEEAETLLESIGLGRDERPRRLHQRPRGDMFAELTAEQRDALRVARAANDQETVQAILDEAGLPSWRPAAGGPRWR